MNPYAPQLHLNLSDIDDENYVLIFEPTSIPSHSRDVSRNDDNGTVCSYTTLIEEKDFIDLPIVEEQERMERSPLRYSDAGVYGFSRLFSKHFSDRYSMYSDKAMMMWRNSQYTDQQTTTNTYCYNEQIEEPKTPSCFPHREAIDTPELKKESEVRAPRKARTILDEKNTDHLQSKQCCLCSIF